MNKTDSNFLQSKKNLKWFESRIENFNKAVPLQIKLLATHKNDILNQYRLGNYVAMKQERSSAERTIRHLKQLLVDTDQLREQVKDSDLNRFDKLIFHSRETINKALKDFNDLYRSLEVPNDQPEKRRFPNYFEEDDAQDQVQKQIILHENEDVWNLRQQREIADNMETIQKDVHTVNQIFRDLAVLVNDQKPQVEALEENIASTHESVVAAEREIAQAANKVHNAAYPLVGAILGSCVGGPVGLVAGLKIGTAVALTCSVIGFSGGKVLNVKQRRTQKQIMESVEKQKAIKS
ncbi:syntaxin-17 [Planococcus citri]|uniref:syntaxin-17 n=1 Tax=Planococcus citri TaxID=170843 RepID=UPI0031F9688D